MSANVLLSQAIHALRTGDHSAARSMLHELTQADPQAVDGWLWLAAVSADPAQKRTYLERVLLINPSEQRAHAALLALDASAPSPASSLPLAAEPIPAPSVDLARIDTASGSTRPSADKPTPKRSPFAQPQFVATGVRARSPIPWTLVALVVALMLVIPVALWLM